MYLYLALTPPTLALVTLVVVVLLGATIETYRRMPALG